MKTSQLCKTARPQPCRKDVRFNLTCVPAFHGLAFHWGMPGSRLFQFLQGEIQYFRLPLRQHCQEKLLLQITEEWGIMDQLLDLTHVDPGNNPAQGAVASLIPQRGNKIEIPDFFPLQRDRGGWYLTLGRSYGQEQTACSRHPPGDRGSSRSRRLEPVPRYRWWCCRGTPNSRCAGPSFRSAHPQ